MTVDYFLIDAPETVPIHFAAWEQAESVWREASDRLFSLDVWQGPEFEALNNEASAAKREADRLERVCRSAWHLSLEARRA